MSACLCDDLPDYRETQLKTYDYTRHKPEYSNLDSSLCEDPNVLQILSNLRLHTTLQTLMNKTDEKVHLLNGIV
jgi:hypothetical protein